MAIIRLERAFRGEPNRLLGLIHDEVLVEITGSCRLDLQQNTEGNYELCYVPDQEAIDNAERAKSILENAQTELFNDIVKEEEQDKFPGIAEYGVAPFWSEH